MAQEAWASAGVRPPGTGWTYWARGLSTKKPEGAGRVRETTLSLFCCGDLLLGGPPCQPCPGAGWQAEVRWGPPPMGPPQAVEASASGRQGLSEQTVLSWVTPWPEPQPRPPRELAFFPGTPGPEAPTEGWGEPGQATATAPA